MSYHDWLQAAYGSPQGEDGDNQYGWTKKTNTERTYTGCSVDTSDGSHSAGGVKKYALSAWNVCDCVGDVWEWLSDFVLKGGMGTFDWHDVMPGDEVGQIYGDSDSALIQFIAGGNWHNGVFCGCRTLYLYNCPWNVNTYNGSRFARDAL